MCIKSQDDRKADRKENRGGGWKGLKQGDPLFTESCNVMYKVMFRGSEIVAGGTI